MRGLAPQYQPQTNDRMKAAACGGAPGGGRQFEGAGHAHHFQIRPPRPQPFQPLQRARQQALGNVLVEAADHQAEAPAARAQIAAIHPSGAAGRGGGVIRKAL